MVLGAFPYLNSLKESVPIYEQSIGKGKQGKKVPRAPRLADRVKALFPRDRLNLLGWDYGRVSPQGLGDLDRCQKQELGLSSVTEVQLS